MARTQSGRSRSWTHSSSQVRRHFRRARCVSEFRADVLLVMAVETMATIGYSAPESIFFNDCLPMLLLITAQTVSGLFLDAALLGVIFNRIARGSPRANTVIFSDRAVVRRIRGRCYLMFQVCEMRKHALSESPVLLALRAAVSSF